MAAAFRGSEVLMQRSGERAALAAMVLSLAAAAASAPAAGGGMGPPTLYLYLWTVGTCALVAVRLYLARRVREEAEELRMAAVRPEAALFAPAAADAGAGGFARSAAVFERWVVPWATPVLGAVALVGAVQGWRGLPAGGEGGEGSRWLVAAGRESGAAFLLLVAARYYLSAAAGPGLALLRGVGVVLGAAAIGAGMAAGAALAHWAGLDRVAVLGWRVLAVWTGALGAEQWVRTLLELYRPRRADESPSAPYESAFVRWILSPASWWRAAAESVDYQFGFEFSRTRAARGIARALAPLVAVQAAVLYGWSGVAILGPEEEGVRERLGRPLPEPEGLVGPGWHWTWPWPFETIRRAPVRRLQRLTIGYEGDEGGIAEMLWTRAHYRREDLFLSGARALAGTNAPAAAPVGVLAVNIPVEYRITNVVRYLYGAADPHAAIRAVATRAVTAELAGRDVMHVLGAGQAEFGRTVAERLRREVGRLNLGIEVTFVGLRDVHPPVEVAEAFEDVVAAMERREAAVLRARGEAARMEAVARAAAEGRRLAAMAERGRRSVVAAAEAERFRARQAAAAASPVVYAGRAALDAVVAALQRPRLYLIAAAAGREVVQLNLEPKVSSVLWDIGVLTNRSPAGVRAEEVVR
ncbi:MAG: protease modulator HflK [Kiritimatiellae bacterium]|nr:protease modulator HflK [Kiritimatiellia bacterium]